MSQGAGYEGPWLVRMASGHPAHRAIEPLRAENVDRLTEALSGIVAAISLLGPGEHVQISIDRTESMLRRTGG